MQYCVEPEQVDKWVENLRKVGVIIATFGTMADFLTSLLGIVCCDVSKMLQCNLYTWMCLLKTVVCG